MTVADARALGNGVYELRWKSGGKSLAAVGRDEHGVPWFAPTNWVGFEQNERPPTVAKAAPSWVPCQKWALVESARRMRQDYG